MFTRAERVDYYCPKSIDAQVPIGDEHPDVSLAAPTASIRPQSGLQSVIGLLKQKYPNQIQVTVQFKSFATIEIAWREPICMLHNCVMHVLSFTPSPQSRHMPLGAESFRGKLYFLIIDKLAVGAIIALAFVA